MLIVVHGWIVSLGMSLHFSIRGKPPQCRESSRVISTQLKSQMSNGFGILHQEWLMLNTGNVLKWLWLS